MVEGIKNYIPLKDIPKIDVCIPHYEDNKSPPLRYRRKSNAPAWYKPDQLRKSGSPDTKRQAWLLSVITNVARANDSNDIPWAFRTLDEEGLHWFDRGAAAFLKNGDLAEFGIDNAGVVTHIGLMPLFWDRIDRGVGDVPLQREISRLVWQIENGVSRAGLETGSSYPFRAAPTGADLRGMLERQWDAQRGRCALCHGAIALNSSNKLLRISCDRIDSSVKIYCQENVHLRPVEIRDSKSSLFMIQAWDGTIRTDRRPMGEDGAALSGQADGPRT